MPVIVNSRHNSPFSPIAGSLAAIDQSRAETQEIRPLEIAIINLMADKRATERQLTAWLGHTPLQVCVTYAATDSYIHEVRRGRTPKNTPASHINTFYNAWSEIRDRKFDGLIVTGVNALKPRVEQEAIWSEVTAILDWSRTNVFSSLFLCWGAKAALKHFHDIDSLPQERKIWGVYPHHVVSDQTEILSGFADRFDLPVSRWKTPDAKALAARSGLEIVATSDEVGANLIVEGARTDASPRPYPRRVYLLAHPEYDTGSLQDEYTRDHGKNPQGPVPAHYFPNNDPLCQPINTWRPCGHVYTNWVHATYEATPYHLSRIPHPHVGTLSLK